MPWNRNDPDPIEIKRRQLAEQERLLAEKMSQLTEELHQSGNPLPPDPKSLEPPVWRREDEAPVHRTLEPTPARKGALARQRQRDMVLFFIFVGLFLFVVAIVIWLFYTHVNNGA